VCIGDLNRRINLHRRAIQEPAFADTNFDEDFKTVVTVWAGVKTTPGRVIFNGVNEGAVTTHEILIRYLPWVTSQTWIELDGSRLDILSEENLDERGEFLRLQCVEKGLVTVEASKA
jgi:SPP1 family predicted phage head-tail adaptor